jgi:hypothetical protein
MGAMVDSFKPARSFKPSAASNRSGFKSPRPQTGERLLASSVRFLF